MARVAMAVAAHPDDIEMMMAGTLIMLGDAGYELHYMTVANGSCGSMTLSPEETAQVRGQESRNAARSIGAMYHEPLVDDLMIYYEDKLVRKLCAVVRQVRPNILLLPSPQDYMEDHMNASRLMVTAAFCRSMPNYITNPPSYPVDTQMAVYHALPHSLRDQLRKPLYPDFYVDIASVLTKKREMLACHVSQKEWLDETQRMDNYLNTMVEISAQVGRMSARFTHAEGWRRHCHLGFGPENFDPLYDALRDYAVSTQGENNGKKTKQTRPRLVGLHDYRSGNTR